MGTKEIAVRLREVRKERRRLQAEVADSLGVSRTHYASVETGKTRTSQGLLRLFSELYGIRLEWLTTGAEPKQKSREERIQSMVAKSIGEREATGQLPQVREAREPYVVHPAVPPDWKDRLLAILDRDYDKIEYSIRNHNVTLQCALLSIAEQILRNKGGRP